MDKNRPPGKIDKYGTQFWYDDNRKCHNDETGDPAVIWTNGSKFWCKHGKYHNDNGPAIIWSNGNEYWYIDDEELSEEQFKQHKIKQFIDGDEE